jgi:ATP-dependent DNA ligase
LVIESYILGTRGVDSVIVGYYEGDDLIYVARVRNGFVQATRRQVFEKLQSLQICNCPFVNLPEAARRWGKVDG